MKIIGKGTIHWPIVTDDGKTITLTIHNCYHVPAIPVRLFSPQTFCRQYSTSANAHLYVNADYSSLSWLDHTKRIQYDQLNNLPFMFTAPSSNNMKCFLSSANSPFGRQCENNSCSRKQRYIQHTVKQ